MLDLKFSKRSQRFLDNLDKKEWIRIIDKIEQLRINPFPQDIKRVQGKRDKVFRIRVGYHRIQYVVISKNNLLFIAKIDKRPRAY